MKQFLIPYVFFLASCTAGTKEPPVMVSILKDRTDSMFLLKPDASSILHLFNLSDNNKRAAGFRYSEIRDHLLTPIQEIRLPGEEEAVKENIAHEPLYLERMAGMFMDSVEKVIAASNMINDSTTLPQSYCFEKISNELSATVRSKPQRSYLVVYSNLFQNSRLLSVFNVDTRNIILSNPDSITKKFADVNLLPDILQGVTVVFVFLPKNRQEEELYLGMVTVYKALLEQRQAKVFIETSSTFRFYE